MTRPAKVTRPAKLTRSAQSARGRAAANDADGRRLRAARNYESVVTAVLDIARECPPGGIYLPSAAEVAARAGVSERTVFRHFADLNALFVAAASRMRPIQDAYMGPRPNAPRVTDRIAELVQLRSKLYEEVAPVRRVAIHLSHTHPLLVEQLAHAFTAARAQVADVFAPELSRLDAKSRSLMLDSLDLAASWASWDNLRTVQGCSVPRARQIVTELLTDLLATVPRANATRPRRWRCPGQAEVFLSSVGRCPLGSCAPFERHALEKTIQSAGDDKTCPCPTAASAVQASR